MQCVYTLSRLAVALLYTLRAFGVYTRARALHIYTSTFGHVKYSFEQDTCYLSPDVYAQFDLSSYLARVMFSGPAAVRAFPDARAYIELASPLCASLPYCPTVNNGKFTRGILTMCFNDCGPTPRTCKSWTFSRPETRNLLLSEQGTSTSLSAVICV